MSQTVLFEIGAVIFVAVSTAVFIYGLTMFRDWQDRDDTAAQVGVPSGGDEPLAAAAAPDGVVELIAQVQHSASNATGDVSRSSAA